ncbi:hypothetical protein HOLleu_43360 [Holothuria leucospilota]|uniref:DED domain-containing protein n=1 Tax=Holothuria leucospilota TaxID=206669 RepID=A0A9Q0YH21_HOLLE|nr:hypothetical protein HOLleu_43360 [Holothuria leucospilota]
MANNYSRAVAVCVVEISNVLEENKFADLIKFCKLRKSETFSEKHAEECTDFFSLFQKLHELDVIQCGNICFVEEILKDIGRIDLAKKMKNANENGEATETDGGTTETDGGNSEEHNQQQQRQGTYGGQAPQSAQNSNNLVVIGDNNRVMKGCVVNVNIQQ